MRPLRTAGTLLALLALVRCGGLALPGHAPEGEPPTVRVSEPVPSPVQKAPVIAPVVRAPVPTPESEVPYPESVRELVRSLGTPTCGCGRWILIDETGQPLPNQDPREVKVLRLWGETAYADYDAILTDPESQLEEIWGTCSVIRDLPGDRRRFVPELLLRLATPDALVPGDGTMDDTRRRIRERVIETLSDLGDERDAVVLVRVMRAYDLESAFAAAKALTQIGGQRELDEVIAWVASHDPRLPFTSYLKKRCDERQSRLRTMPAGRNF